MKNIYIEETMARKNEPIIQKHLKQIKLNRILWIVASSIALIVTILMAALGKSVLNWDARSYGISIGIPAIVTVLTTVMTVLIWLGNQVGVKLYKSDKIIFYSGPWTNVLYINDQIVYSGSSEHKMVGTLCDESLCKIMLGTTYFRINILPPGSDPITGIPKEVSTTPIVSNSDVKIEDNQK